MANRSVFVCASWGAAVTVVILLLGCSDKTEGHGQGSEVRSIPATCSPRYAGRPPTNRNAGASKALVPADASRLLLCRYGGLDEGMKLAREQSVAGSKRVARTARIFNSLPVFPSGTFACPSDDGSVILAIFGYAKAPDDPVLVQPQGCQGVSNGRLSPSLRVNSKLTRALRSAVGF